MAIKFQYNKTSLQQLEKQLKVRVRTLPIIKNKESALRMEVKRCKSEAAALDEKLEREIQAYEAMFALWNEFDSSLIKVSDVHLGVKKIAGVGCRCSKTLISKYVPTACSMPPNGMPTAYICSRCWHRRLSHGSLSSPNWACWNMHVKRLPKR